MSQAGKNTDLIMEKEALNTLYDVLLKRNKQLKLEIHRLRNKIYRKNKKIQELKGYMKYYDNTDKENQQFSLIDRISKFFRKS